MRKACTARNRRAGRSSCFPTTSCASASSTRRCRRRSTSDCAFRMPTSPGTPSAAITTSARSTGTSSTRSSRAMARATASASRCGARPGTTAHGCARRRSRMRRSAPRARTTRRRRHEHGHRHPAARGMAAVGDLHPQPARPRAQARRQPARRRRGDGGEERARRLHAPQRGRVDLGRARGGHPRLGAGRQGGAVRSRQRQGVPASDVLPDARRGEAPVSAVAPIEVPSRAAPHAGDASLDEALLALALRQADSPLVLAQRLCEWIGQARLWYAYAGEIEVRMGRVARGEDDFAFRRDASAFRNVLLVEQPNGDFAHTIVRQFLFDAAQHLALDALARSRDARVAAIAAKAAKEVDYHVERSADWVVRLGDGTAESHERMQRALDALWPYTGELFDADATDLALAEAGFGVDPRTLAAQWRETVDAVLADATLARPADGYVQRGGRDGRHSEHLGHLLCELQFLQRAYPDARW